MMSIEFGLRSVSVRQASEKDASVVGQTERRS